MSETIQTPVRIHSTGSTLGIQDAAKRFIIRKGVSQLPHQAFFQLESDFKEIIICVNDHARLVAENAEYAAEVERLRAALCRKIPMFPIVREAGTEAKGDD